MTGVYELTLRAPDGRERHELVWHYNEQVRQDYITKSRRNGLEVIDTMENG